MIGYLPCKWAHYFSQARSGKCSFPISHGMGYSLALTQPSCLIAGLREKIWAFSSVSLFLTCPAAPSTTTTIFTVAGGGGKVSVPTKESDRFLYKTN